jgi:hypothetical protein
VKDIKRLIIPIPIGGQEEAKNYINAEFPSYGYCKKKQRKGRFNHHKNV